MRRLCFMLMWLAGFLIAVAAVNWIVNPYGAWRWTLIDPSHRITGMARTEAGERVTLAYRLRGERPTTLLVGSSRVVWGMYIEHGSGDGVLNASMGGASLAEIAAILRLAAANPRLKRVIWGLDFYAFEERFVGFRHPETRLRLEGDQWQAMRMLITDTLLSLQALDDSRKVVQGAAQGRKRRPFTSSVPWPEEVIRARLEDPGGPGLARANDATLKAQLADWVGNYSQYRPSDSLMSLFRSTVTGVRAAGIDVVLFVPPLSRCELEAIDQTGSWGAFQSWKRRLLKGGPYWDFSGFGKLDRLNALFLDVAHFWPAVGHVMLRQFLGEGCAQCGDVAAIVRHAGVWVDGATIEAHLAQQDAARTAPRSGDDRCARVVAEMLGERHGVKPRTGVSPEPARR